MTAFLLGLALLILSAELVVRGATRLAASLGVKPLLLGLTIVSVGTSAPELAVGITANTQGSGGLVVGNIAGTNLLNILFILGASALIRPLPLQLQILRLELPVSIAVAFLLLLLAWDGTLSSLDGLVLFGAAILYTTAVVRLSRRETPAIEQEYAEAYQAAIAAPGRRAQLERARHALTLAIGIALSVVGADWLVDGASSIARGLGVSETIIGLTIVAIGTSAPELATTIVATLKDERDVAVGNLIGSSIYNVVVILGVTCMVAPDSGVPVAAELLHIDLPLMMGSALLCVPVFTTGRLVSRREGAMFVMLYLAYMASLLWLRT